MKNNIKEIQDNILKLTTQEKDELLDWLQNTAF